MLGSVFQDLLQEDLNVALDWALHNKMLLNEVEFQLLINHQVHSHTPNVNMKLLKVLLYIEVLLERFYFLPSSKSLLSSASVTDLGVLNDVAFESHINQIFLRKLL